MMLLNIFYLCIFTWNFSLLQSYYQFNQLPPVRKQHRKVPKWKKAFLADSAFDEIEQYNDAADLAHNHVRGSHLYEGDIMELNNDYRSTFQKRGSIKSERFLWKARVIPYSIAHNRMNASVAILEGLAEIENHSCIRFIERTTEEDYLHFILDKGCWSYIGMMGGKQVISIGIGCEHKEIVTHEVLHALGFYHEQSRLDRDDYIDIIWKNVLKDNSFNFDKAPPNKYTDLNLPYDMKSVMHYGRFAFTKNGKVTIKSKRFPLLRLGNHEGMSEGDIDELNGLYKCEVLPLGGFGEWKDKVYCSNGIRIRYRVCYGNTASVCAGPGLEKGIQEVKELCETKPGQYPLSAYMEGCYHQRSPLVSELPMQPKPTDDACKEYFKPSEDFYDWKRKTGSAFKLCGAAAKEDGFQVFGITDYCRCHYGDDTVDIKTNGKSKWCRDGYGIKESIYLYRLEEAPVVNAEEKENENQEIDEEKTNENEKEEEKQVLKQEIKKRPLIVHKHHNKKHSKKHKIKIEPQPDNVEEEPLTKKHDIISLNHQIMKS